VTPIRAAATRGEPALVAFMTAGFPSARAVSARSCWRLPPAPMCVEIGVPFTDPMADGMTIQRSSQAALRQGVSLRWILGATRSPCGALPAPLVLMSYLNPLLQYGYERLAARAAAVGGLRTSSCPTCRSTRELNCGPRSQAAGVALVQMVHAGDHDRASCPTVCAASEGFVYAVTMTGTTGRNPSRLPDCVARRISDRVTAAVTRCRCVRVSASARASRWRVCAVHVAGVVVGSALVEVLERGEDPTAWLNTLRHG
jgi:tryptophan synthase alpha chain